MPTASESSREVPGYCAMCVSRCGSVAVVENDEFVQLKPDPSHPTGKALCAKGRAAPELVYHPDRLTHPLKRTRPKGDGDPGWERISWDEALDHTAARLRELADEHGPESVVFSASSPSTTAIDDALDWVQRLRRAFGSPNFCGSVELCGWGRYLATMYTFGDSVPGLYMPDLERAGCILYWGYNPNVARLVHAVQTSQALKGGAKLISVDPRHVGPAAKADVWLRVRPGTDSALALGITHVMIDRGWYDRSFVRRWTNGPLLVCNDTGRFLRADRLTGGDGAGRYVARDAATGAAVIYDPASGAYADPEADLDLFGDTVVETRDGPVACRPAFDVVAERCRRWTPDRVAEVCDVDPGNVEAAARLLWEERPVAYYAWSGVEMQTNATQTARAIAQLYTLTGSFDGPGGNVKFEAVPTNDISGLELLSDARRAPALGLEEMPLGPARWESVSTDELYRGILQDEPYPVRGLVGFGANLLLSHADGDRGRDALGALDFYVHLDLFMNPTAELADIVLPVASAFEREALKTGFEVSQEAQSRVQLRQPVVAPRGESRPDIDVIFDLASRLGLGEHFWDGDIDAAYRHQLAPTDVSLDELRAEPRGVQLPLETRHRKFAEPVNGGVRGFDTPTGKIELYSETMLEHGYAPVPEHQPPAVAPETRPDLADRFPLVLTCTKHTLFCESQHRALPSLRRRAPDPEVEIHPDAAAERGIDAGDWVRIRTPHGSSRARATFNESLAPNVVCGQHGWWQECAEIDAPGYDAFGDDNANFNAAIGNDAFDPISGSVPHRAYLCDVRPAG